MRKGEGQEAVLFVNKKNQKNFLSIPCRWRANSPSLGARRSKVGSFFASFFPEKEDLPSNLSLAFRAAA